jgi:signal transduction histidine kinase/ActR/RegA family two-component response regulator
MSNPGFVLSPLIAAGMALVLMILVFPAIYRDRSRRIFLFVLLSLQLWAVTTFLLRSSRTLQAALIYDRLMTVFLLSLFATFLHFCHLYTGRRSRWPIYLLYAGFAAAAGTGLLTDLVIRDVRRLGDGYAPQVGPLSYVFFGIMQLLLVANMIRMLRAARREISTFHRKRYLLLGLVVVLPLAGSAADGFTSLPPILIWTNLAFCTICSLVILHYRLFNIRTLARRGLLRLVVGTLIAVPFVGGIVAANVLLSGTRNLLVIYAVSLLAYVVLMWPAYEWARWRLEKLFSSERLDHMQALRELARSPGLIDGSREAVGRLLDLVQRALTASHVALLEPRDDSRSLHLAARSDGPVETAGPVVGAASPIVLWLCRHRTVLPARAFAVEPFLQTIPQSERAALAGLKAELFAPLLTTQGELSGILVVGPKATRRQYTLDDVQLLENLGGEAAMTLENARLYRDAVRARETLEAWLNSLPDVVAIIDRDDVIRFLNKEGSERLGAGVGQRSFLRAAPPSESGPPQRSTETIRGREYEIASAPLLEPGGELSSVLVMRDVTERRQEEERREQLEARARLASHLASIGEMASGIAHEINNPLTAVIGYSQLLAALPLPDEAREAARQIQQGSQRVAGIVQRLLTFARQRKPQRTEVDMNEVVRSTVALRDYALRTGNIRVTLGLDPALPRTVADGQQMQQVLLNLIVNAETAMSGSRGRGELAISTETRGSAILVSVRDDGPGIPLEIQERIFDPFFTTREVGQGTGLGLSICHGIVSEHGGRIWVQSEPGQGAAFHLRIPVVAAARAAPAPEAARPEGVEIRTRVLVVDDEPSIRALLTVLLQKQGHEVDTVADGESAVRSVASRRYGIILLDVRMPDMSGLEVFLRIKEIAGSIASRVIFITGDVMADETRGLLAKTGAPAIAKPFQADELLAAIEKILKGRAD